MSGQTALVLYEDLFMCLCHLYNCSLQLHSRGTDLLYSVHCTSGTLHGSLLLG